MRSRVPTRKRCTQDGARYASATSRMRPPGPISPYSLHPARTEIYRPPLRREREQRPRALERAAELGQRCAGRCERVHDPGGGATKLQYQRIAPGQLLLQPAHAVAFLEVAKLRRLGDRGVEVPELVNDAGRFRVRAGPDAALRQAFDLLRPALARFCDRGYEVLVGVLDGGLQDRFRLGPEAAIEIRLARQLGGAEPVVRDADLVERALESRDHGEDADRA